MSLGDISVNLNLDGKEFELTINKADALVKQFVRTVKSANDPLQESQGELDGLGKAIKRVADASHSVISVVQITGRYLGLMGREVVRASAELERLEAIMTGLEQTQGNEALENAANTIDYLRQMAKEAPFEISALQDSFIKFKTAGIDPTNGSVQALVDSVAKFGGGGEELKRASVAIQQMAGKGVVSMEELRQQLGEAVPNAMQMMADGMHLSMAELTKVVSTGTLEATSAIDAMLAEMERTSGGAAKEMMKTWNGLVSRFKTSVDEIWRMIGDGGLFENLEKQLSDVVDILDSDEMKKFATETGRMLNDFVDGIRYLIDNANELIPVLKVIGAQLAWSFSRKLLTDVMALSGSFKSIHATLSGQISGSLNKFNQQINAGQSAFTKYSAAVEKHNRVLTGTVNLFGTMYLEQYKAARAQGIYNARVELGKAALAGFGNMAKVAGRAMATMLGPAGAILMLIYEVSQAFDVFGTKIDELREKAARGVVEVQTEEFNQLKKSMGESAKSLEKYQAKLKDVGDLSFHPNLVRAELYKKNIAQLTQELADGGAAIKHAISSFTNAAANEVTSSALAQMKAGQASINAEYQASRDLINKWKAKADSDSSLDKEKTKTEFDKRVREAQKHQTEQILTLAKQLISAESKASRERIQANTKMSIEERDARLRGVDEAERELIKQAESNASSSIERIKTIDDANAKALSSDRTPALLLNKYKSLLVKTAGINAELNGESAELAKTLQQLANQEIKSATNQDLSKVSEKLLALQNELKIKKELASADKTIVGLQAKQQAGLIKMLAGKENPYLKMTGDAKQLTIALAKAKDTQKRWIEDGEATTSQLAEQSEKITIITGLLDEQSNIDQGASILGLRSKTNAINQELMTTAELRELKRTLANEELQQLDQLELGLDKVALATGISVEKLKEYIDDYREAIGKKAVDGTKTATGQMFEQWAKFGENMENVMASAISGVADQLTNLAMTGKADFADLANSITTMITKITIQYSIMKAMTGMGFDFSTTPTPTPVPSAMGNIVGPKGAMSLQKFAKGGIAKANNPQVAVFGEGDQNEAFVPLPDGRRIPVDLRGGGAPPNVEVNVINQSGQQVTGESQGQRFDGEKFVLDIVLKAVNRPGNFRSSMKGAIGNG